MIPCYAEWDCRPYHDSFGRLWLSRKGTTLEGGYTLAPGETGTLEEIRLPEGIYGCRVSARWRAKKGGGQGHVAFLIEDYSRYISGNWIQDGGKSGQLRGDLVGASHMDDPTLVEQFYKTEERRMLEFQLSNGGAGKALAAAAGGELRVRDGGTMIGASFSFLAAGAGVSVGIALPDETEWKQTSLPQALKLCDFDGATIKLKSRGVRLVAGYSTVTMTLALTGGGKIEMNWSGAGFEWGVEGNASTTVVGKLLKHSWFTPTFKFG